MAMIKFLKGTQEELTARIGTSQIVTDALYFVTDSHKVYMGTGTATVQEYSAIEVVDNIAALPAYGRRYWRQVLLCQGRERVLLPRRFWLASGQS